MSNSQSYKEIRHNYNDHINLAYQNKFKQIFKSIHEENKCIGDIIARDAFETRHSIKEEHQEQTPLLGNIVIGARQFLYYHLKPVFTHPKYTATKIYDKGLKYLISNPDYDYFINIAGKTPEQIAYSAFKTDGKNLNLADNGFGEILALSEQLKKYIPVELYPEHITSTAAECFKTSLEEREINEQSVCEAFKLCGMFLEFELYPIHFSNPSCYIVEQ